MRKLTLVLFCVLVGGSLFAQGNLEYEDNTGARPLGMGRTFVALADDGYAALWNPPVLICSLNGHSPECSLDCISDWTTMQYMRGSSPTHTISRRPARLPCLISS